MSAIERVAETNPIWWPTTQEESGPTVEGRYAVDLVVIGLAAAYYVTEYRPELAVAAVEAEHVGAGATGRSRGRSDRAGRRAHGCGGRQGRAAHWSRRYQPHRFRCVRIPSPEPTSTGVPANMTKPSGFLRLACRTGSTLFMPGEGFANSGTMTNIYRGAEGISASAH